MIYTIGYERRELDEFVALLGAAGIERVIDVRQLPLSRRHGFSKTPLAAALAGAGIEYLHLRSAGNPFRHAKVNVLGLYKVYLERSPEVIDEVLAASAGKRTALLCLEREPSECHRGVLASAMGARGVTVEHLGR
jgi:uncharacterized protein (DUF488 family)